MPGYDTDTTCLVKKNVSWSCKNEVEELDVTEVSCREKCIATPSCSFFGTQKLVNGISCKICEYGKISGDDDDRSAGFCPKYSDANLDSPIPSNPNPEQTRFWCQKGNNGTIGRFPYNYEGVTYTEPALIKNKHWCGFQDSGSTVTYYWLDEWLTNGNRVPQTSSGPGLVECELCTGEKKLGR